MTDLPIRGRSGNATFDGRKRLPSDAAVRRFCKRLVRWHVRTGDMSYLWKVLAVQRWCAHVQAIYERGQCYNCFSEELGYSLRGYRALRRTTKRSNKVTTRTNR